MRASLDGSGSFVYACLLLRCIRSSRIDILPFSYTYTDGTTYAALITRLVPHADNHAGAKASRSLIMVDLTSLKPVRHITRVSLRSFSETALVPLQERCAGMEYGPPCLQSQRFRLLATRQPQASILQQPKSLQDSAFANRD